MFEAFPIIIFLLVIVMINWIQETDEAAMVLLCMFMQQKMQLTSETYSFRNNSNQMKQPKLIQIHRHTHTQNTKYIYNIQKISEK